MYDTIIIGAGPAGMTAAIYTARKKLNTLVLAKELGGQMVWSSGVENYSGFTFISGADLTLKFQEHLTSIKEDLTLQLGVEVVSLEKNITSFSVEDSAGNVYYGKTVIIASGKVPRHLGIPGEKELYGKGVAICATCDAPLYKGKAVAVVGGGNSAMDAVLALAKVATKVHLVNINDNLVGDEVMHAKIIALPNVVLHNKTKTTAIDGDKTVEAIQVQPLGMPVETLAVSGVFIEIGYEPSSSFDLLTKKKPGN